MTTATGRTITLTLPFPPTELSPNARCSWQAKARVAKAYRLGCGLEARRQAVGITTPMQRARMMLIFICCRRRRGDDDNLIASFKNARDSLVDVALLAGDGPNQLELQDVMVIRCRCGNKRKCVGDRVEVVLMEVLS